MGHSFTMIILLISLASLPGSQVDGQKSADCKRTNEGSKAYLNDCGHCELPGPPPIGDTFMADKNCKLACRKAKIPEGSCELFKVKDQGEDKCSCTRFHVKRVGVKERLPADK
ncbi:hypothetical protein HDE_01696 [Halotydeus destructor]|nr:hypothetical protein HDE_01696 [Halotydeus destructor]